jgi:hypothetical protein
MILIIIGNSLSALITGVVYSTTSLWIFLYSSLPTLASNTHSFSSSLIVIYGISDDHGGDGVLDRTHKGTGVLDFTVITTKRHLFFYYYQLKTFAPCTVKQK